MDEETLRKAALVIAGYFGIDTQSEPNLIEIAIASLSDLPPGWELGIADGEHEGVPYFIDGKHGKSEWIHPFEAKYKRLVEDARRNAAIEQDLARLRELKWRQWVEGKELLDASIKIIPDLDTSRADDEEQLRELVIALSAVDIMTGVDRRSPHSIHFHSRKGDKKAKRTQSEWLKWMFKNHTFNDVVITDMHYDGFSASMKERIEGNEHGEKVLSSLQYCFPGHGKGLDSLNKDQTLMNTIFVKECSKLWANCTSELNDRVYEYIAREKTTVDLGAEPKSDSTLAYNCMYALSLPRLRSWAEDDSDRQAEEARRARENARISDKAKFDMWLRYKDELLITLPPDVPPAKAAPRMCFAPESLTDVRPKEAGPPSTMVDLMLHSGLKQIHALSKGDKSISRDLEKSRQRLLEMGFVHKSNYANEDDSDYRFDATRLPDDRAHNVTLMDRQERDRLKELNKGKAYEAWAELKEAREQALFYLNALPRPKLSDVATSTTGPGSIKANAHRAGGGPTERPPVPPPSYYRSSASGNATNAVKPYSSLGAVVDSNSTGMDVSKIIGIGQALKKVDRTLFSEWARWCEACISPATAGVLWDFFYPISCDLHGMVGTEAKNAFLRILYANANFVAFMDHPYRFTYKEFLPEKWRMQERLLSKKSGLSEEEKRQFLFQAPLTRSELSRLLLDMGISMSDLELKALVDAFDPDDTGSIDMNEFLKYTWPKRETNAGALDMLSKKCCWSSTCRKTGMVNGYVVTIRDKEGSERAFHPGVEEESEADEAGQAAATKEDSKRTDKLLKHQLQEKVMSTLSNGDQKIVKEVADRQKRERTLRRFGLLPRNGEIEKNVARRCMRGISPLSIIRRKLAVSEVVRAEREKLKKTLNTHSSALEHGDLAAIIPGSATINIPYAPVKQLSCNDTIKAEQEYNVQNLMDDCEMYEANEKGLISVVDFETVLAEGNVKLTSKEMKYILRHFGREGRNSTVLINHIELCESLRNPDTLEVGDAVETLFRGGDKWCPALVIGQRDGVYDVKYLSLTLSGKVKRFPKKKYEEDVNDEGDDAYANDEYEEEEEDPEKKHKNHKNLARLMRGAKNEPCEFALWLESHDGRRDGIRHLASISHDNRCGLILQGVIDNCSVPSTPVCWVVNPDEEDASFEDGEVLEPCTEVLLRWRPGGSGDLVSFYSLEFAGRAGCIGAEMRYKEIYRDPPSASGVKCCYQYRMKSLDPSTAYLFRIRAVNGSGSGPYTYITASTRMVRSIYPRVVKLSTTSVTLRWLFTLQSHKRLAQLRKLYFEGLYKSDIYLKDKIEELPKDELAKVLDEGIQSFPELKSFLSVVKSKYSIPDNAWGEAKFLTVLDYMNKDSGERISWEELERFFIASGFVELVSSSSGRQGALTSRQAFKVAKSVCKCGTSTPSVRASLSMTGPGKGQFSKAIRTLRSSTNGYNASNIYASGFSVVTVVPCEECCAGNVTKTTYTIEQFGADGEYHDIMRTTGGQGTINRLVPGETYKFRVYGLNEDGSAGPRSEEILLHMPYETPAAPYVALASACCSDGPARALIGPRSIVLRWKERQPIKLANPREKSFVKKMLMEWSGQLSEGPTVTTAELEKAFKHFDVNNDGFIDAAELGTLLGFLGIAPTEQKFKSAFNEICDRDRDGSITFNEFNEWWHFSGVDYVLKRSTAIRDPRNASEMLDCIAAGASRGSSTLERSAALNFLVRDAALYAYRRERPVDIDGDPGAVDEAQGAEGISEKDIVVKSDITTDIVCYRGKELQFEEKGLTPNQMYCFKLRHVGVRSISFLSPPLMIMTAPLPCRLPAFVRLQGSNARLKWYPPDFGAFSFEVQLQLGGAKTSSGEGPIVGSDWVNVYNGQETTWTATAATLTPETNYNLRVVAINAQGTYGDPSPVLSFTTPSREANREPVTKKNAEMFSIECIGDICVGDIILVTERLFKYDNGNIDVSEQNNVTAVASSGASGLSKNISSSKSGSRPSTRDGKSGGTRLDLGVTTSYRKLSLNDSSSSQLNGKADMMGIGADRFGTIPGLGQFAGERVFAAHVVWDNYRTIRDERPEGAPPLDKKTFSKLRKCWLEVIWSRGSNATAKTIELQPGHIICRNLTHLEQFEVYRLPWLHENQRRPLEEELNLLANCYGKCNATHRFQS